MTDPTNDVDEFSLRRAMRNPEQTMGDYIASHHKVLNELGRLGNGIEALEQKWADKYPDVAHDLHALLRDPEWRP